MEPRAIYGFTLTTPLNNRSNGFGLDAHGAVRFWMAFLRCGSVRFQEIRNLTVRFGVVFRCREPFGAVRLYFMSYGAVRCGFEEGKHPTVNRNEPHRTDRKKGTVTNWHEG